MLYYATKISENIRIREPEGYLICANVPIARTGTQEYLWEEIGMPEQGEGLVTLYRPEEEVFSEATIGSFEGMPLTNDHPASENGVTIENIKSLSVGHVQNVHRGEGEEKNFLIADLIIQDPETIRDVMENKKREISCGYMYELCQEDGKFIQRKIRGNHIAIVDEGRAGHRVSIKDSAPKEERRKPEMAKEVKGIGIFKKMFSHWAKDADPEEIVEAITAIQEISTAAAEPAEKLAEQVKEAEEAEKTLDTDPAAPAAEEPAAEPAADPAAVNDNPELLAALATKLDSVLELLQKALSKDCDTKDEDPDSLEALEKELEAVAEAVVEEGAEAAEEPAAEPVEDPAEAESKFVDPDVINEKDEGEEDPEEKPQQSADAIRAAIRAVRPLIAMLPEDQRKAATDAATASIRKSYGLTEKPAKSAYMALATRKKAADSAEDPSDLGRKIMASRNPNYKK